MLERHTKVPPLELVDSAKEWGLCPGDWIMQTGSIDALIGYLDLVWRDFVQHDGCLLRDGFDEENYNAWMRHANGDRTAVEAVMNHVHILDLFARPEPEPTREQVVVVGRILREMWNAKLAKEYPEVSFFVSFPDEEFEDLLDYEITVYQKR